MFSTKPTLENKKTQSIHNLDEIQSKRLEFYNILDFYAKHIYSQKIKNPKDRIELFELYEKELKEYNSDIDAYLQEIKNAYPPSKKYNPKVSYSNTELKTKSLKILFTLLDDVRNEGYRKIKSIIIMRLLKKIHTETQKAKLQETYTKAFYVYDGVDEEGNRDQERSRKTYFWGVPAKENKNDVAYFFEWLSYFLGGCLVIPIKNTLKYIFEYLPNYIATYFENRAENALRDPTRSFSSPLDYAISSILYWPFKGIWLLGRAIFSPVASAKAGARTGYGFGYALADALGGGEIAKVVTGAYFGFLLGAPSLLIGLAATIIAIIAAPPSLIYLIGKIPFIGAQAAGALTAASETLSGLRLVSHIFQANQMIATSMAPTVAASARTGAGFMALAQLANLAKDGLHIIVDLAKTFYYEIFSKKRDTTQPLEPPPSPDVIADQERQIFPSSYMGMRQQIPFEKPNEKKENAKEQIFVNNKRNKN